MPPRVAGAAQPDERDVGRSSLPRLEGKALARTFLLLQDRLLPALEVSGKRGFGAEEISRKRR